MSIANTRQSGFVQRFRGWPANVERDGGWGRRRPGAAFRGKRSAAVPRQPRRALAAGMGQLNTERSRPRTPTEADNAGQRGLVRIGIEAETAVCDAARRLDRRLLDGDKPSA